MERILYTNGNIHTMDPASCKVEAVVVENGFIKAVGSHHEMDLQWGRAGTKVIDLHGKTVTPGMIDSHLHLSGIAFRFLELDMTGVSSKTEMLRLIKEKADSVPEGQWIVGMGWDENLFMDGSIPSLEELDKAAPHCPIFLKRICYHAFLVNSRALELIHYHPSMTIPAGGEIVKDERTGNPTGLVLESASVLFTDLIPERSYSMVKEGMEQAMDFALRQGLTSIHTNDPLYLGGFQQTYKMFDELIHGSNKNLRCNLLIDYPFVQELAEKGMKTGYGDDLLRIGAVKLFADGALGQRTALLSEPYHDDRKRIGEAIHDQETLYRIVKEIRNHSMPVAVHTIGDQALKNVLDVLDHFPKAAQRDRIIHASLISKDLISRLADPSIIVDIQPKFVPSDYPWVLDRIGEERSALLYAWKTLLEAGVICAGGSDAPVEPLNPLYGIHAAVTRRSPGELHDGWNPAEKVSMMDAVKMFTIGGAYATNEEQLKGSLTPGKLADMTVFSKDIFALEHPDELMEAEVEMTIVGGMNQI